MSKTRLANDALLVVLKSSMRSLIRHGRMIRGPFQDRVQHRAEGLPPWGE